MDSAEFLLPVVYVYAITITTALSIMVHWEV